MNMKKSFRTHFILIGKIFFLNVNGLFQHCSYNLNSAILQLNKEQ